MKMKDQIEIKRKFNQNWIRSIGLSFLRDQKRREEKRRGEEEEEGKEEKKKREKKRRRREGQKGKDFYDF